MTKVTLRKHVKALHPRVRLRRATIDLARDHAREHHRYRPNHFHAGPNDGPSRRPVGWFTGADAVPLAETEVTR